MVRYIGGTLSSTYLRSINWLWLTCTILESLYQFHLAEGCKWSTSLTTMWMGTFFIDLPMFASNHHVVHWEGWRLGDKSWYLVWRKSKVFQFKFDLALPSASPFQGTTMWTETFFYWSPNVCIQSSLWCIGKEEDWARSHDTLFEGSQKYSNSSLIWLSPVWHPFSCRRRYILTSLEIGLCDELQKCLESYLVMVPNLLPLIISIISSNFYHLWVTHHML
jgi:hypothetical protein